MKEGGAHHGKESSRLSGTSKWFSAEVNFFRVRDCQSGSTASFGKYRVNGVQPHPFVYTLYRPSSVLDSSDGHRDHVAPKAKIFIPRTCTENICQLPM